MWRNTCTRSERRNRSPVRLTSQMTDRPKTNPRIATTRYANAARFSAAGVLAHEPVVDAQAHEHRAREQARGLEHEDDRGEHDLPPVRAQHPPHPAQHLVRGGAVEPCLLVDRVGTDHPASHAGASSTALSEAEASDRPVLGRGGEQLRVGPGRDHPPVTEEHDAVGEGDRRGPVGDDQRRPTVHHLTEGGADLVLLRGIDRRRGVVEDQDARVGEHGAGDGDALPLTAGEREPVLADDGVVPGRQRLDELRRAREPARHAPPGRAARPDPRRRCSRAPSPRRGRCPRRRCRRRCAARRPGGRGRRRRRAGSGPPRRRRSAGRAGRPWSCRCRSHPRSRRPRRRGSVRSRPSSTERPGP